MQTEIYVQLLTEGTVIYRPVPAQKINEGFYKLCGHEVYDPEIEDWGFAPGALVITEQRFLDGGVVEVAIGLGAE